MIGDKIRGGFAGFSLGTDLGEATAAKLRAHQIATLISLTPIMMLANVLNVFAIYYFIGGNPDTGYLGFWVLGICTLAILGFFHWYTARNRQPVTKTSKKGLYKAARGAAVLGIMWGIFPAMLYPGADHSTKMVIIAVTTGMLGGGTVSLYIVPPAMFAWIAAMSVGSLFSLIASGQPEDASMIVLFLIYSISMLVAGRSMAKRFANSIVVGLELQDKSETVGLLLKDFAENARDWLWEMDADGVLIRGQQEFKENLGIPITTFDPADHPRSREGAALNAADIRSFECIWAKYLTQQSFHDVTIVANMPGGNRWVNVSGKPLFDQNGSFAGFRGVASNVTEAKIAEERIAHMAHNDSLTGLLNRASFSYELDTQLKKPDREGGWAVMYLDLDGFKGVNDKYGHAIGDQLLIAVAARVKNTFRRRDVVARIGGDEFAILCKSAGNCATLSSLAEKLIGHISTVFDLGDIKVKIGVSIGIAIPGASATNGFALLNNADLALYRAKAEQKGSYRFYQLEMDKQEKHKRGLERDLRDAMRQGELSIYYQPVVKSEDAKVAGFEALIRWYHPIRGQILPSVFIPMAENIGIIDDIGAWVLEQACAEATNWSEEIFLAVNLSPRQFSSGHVISTVEYALNKSGLSPERLELEITESVFIEKPDNVLEILSHLKDMGIAIAMDDFGTGYSSLSYLLKFPFEKLKIDRSLVTSVDSDQNAQNILDTITRLGAVMSLQITAEGIETTEQSEILKSLNCTFLQGYLFGKPMPASKLPAFLLNRYIYSNETTGEIPAAEPEKFAATG